MIRSVFLHRFIKAQLPLPQVIAIRHQSSAVNIEKIEAESINDDLQAIDEEAELKEQAIKKSQNKSNLRPQHYKVVNNTPPYTEPQHWIHGTIKYQRKVYGKYGTQSGFDPSLCWNKEEIAKKKEYEAIAYPYTIQELMAKAQTNRQEKNMRIEKRQQEIAQKLLKADVWKEELFKKIAKKETEALVAKERKDKLIEEVRRHFGYTVDPRDERFKEMLELKEKEQKKAMKEARKKAKEENLVSKLVKGKGGDKKTKTQTNENDEKVELETNTKPT